MSKIIKENTYETIITYSHEFPNNGYNFDDGGMSFPCDAQGNLLSKVTDIAKKNYEQCLNEHKPYLGVVRHKTTIQIPAVLLCDCGMEIDLVSEYMGACQCPKCGQWYNVFGQRLTTPSEWEENW